MALGTAETEWSKFQEHNMNGVSVLEMDEAECNWVLTEAECEWDLLEW